MVCFCVAQDWANLNRFREANEKLGPARTCDSRVVLWAIQLLKVGLIRFRNFCRRETYINRGISGQTTPQMLLRFRQDVLNLWPKVVVILAG